MKRNVLFVAAIGETDRFPGFEIESEGGTIELWLH
jgi:hypothetical protein